jgi:hypothetical protein
VNEKNVKWRKSNTQFLCCVCENFCDSILLLLRFWVPLWSVIKLQFRLRYGKKLQFLRFRLRNTALEPGYRYASGITYFLHLNDFRSPVLTISCRVFVTAECRSTSSSTTIPWTWRRSSKRSELSALASSWTPISLVPTVKGTVP